MRTAVIVAVGLVLALESRPVAMPPPTPPPTPSGAIPVRRVVLALYDSAVTPRLELTELHRLAEMPLNYLGLVVRYHDLQHGLPGIDTMREVRGVLTWFSSNAMREPEAYLRWASRAIDAGARFVVMGSIGATRRGDGTPAAAAALEPFLERLGLERSSGWTTSTYGLRYVLRDRSMVEFERPLPSVLPPFDRYRAGVQSRSYLAVSGASADTRSDLVVVGPRGGYAAASYAVFTHRYRDQPFVQWYINPFEFFRQAFATDEVPKLDPSTVSGRRAFYSHIDGDGWRNLTLIEPYRTRYSIAARVVLEEIIRRYPDFPVTVGPIAADVDPDWHGTAESITVAKETLRLPHVEASVHTYSHPLDWEFFRDAHPGDEQAYRRRDDTGAGSDDVNAAAGEHAIPRSYTKLPFDLAREVAGSKAFVEGLLPPGKRVGLIQWSGSTHMYEAAIAEARRSGMVNINGGDTRFDREFPSHAWVAPLSREVGRERQVYSSNSNENTYTDLWRDRFFGFRFLVKTIRNTGVPRRLKPFNLYYHMYSGERLSSLNAVRANLDYARTLELAPVTTGRFAASVDAFFSTRVMELGPRWWRVTDRGTLQTLRVDRASRLAVDFARSKGVVGQRHEAGSLYVTLDEGVAVAEVALTEGESVTRVPTASRPYLVDGRWRVWDLSVGGSSVSFRVQGFGDGAMRWWWPRASVVDVEWRGAEGTAVGRMAARVDPDGYLRVALPDVAQEGLTVRLRDTGDAHDSQ